MSVYDHQGAALVMRQWEQSEASQAGNPDFDLAANWIDYAANGVTGSSELFTSVFEVLETVSMTRDVLDLALRSNVNPDTQTELATKIVAMRRTLRDELTKQDLNGLVVPFEPGTYNVEATVIENLLFGNVRTTELMAGAISKNAYFQSVLEKRHLQVTLFKMGTEVARNAIELFSDLPPDHPFFQQLTFMTADDIPVYQTLLQKLDRGNAAMSDDDKALMIRLSFDYIEPRHRFGLLTDTLMAEIVDFRAEFHASLPDNLKEAIELYDPERYMASGSLLDNMLFGRISQKYRDGADRIYTTLAGLLRPLGIYETVLALGLDFHVGAGGKRLTSTQRQKLNLARALIRRSDYYLFNRALSSLDARSQEQTVKNVLEYLKKNERKPGIVWVVSNTGMAKFFDRVAVFHRGKLVEDGSHADLIKKNGIFKELLST
jgi:putative ABC transport system ATP-binding protein